MLDYQQGKNVLLVTSNFSGEKGEMDLNIKKLKRYCNSTIQ